MDQIFELMLRICGFCWSVVVAVQAGEGVGLNLGDWKLSLENNPGYCLFAARCGERAFVCPIGRHSLVSTISNCFSDKSSNIKGELHSLHVRLACYWVASFYAMTFFGIFVNFQLVECVLQAFEIKFMIIFKLAFFDFIQTHLGVA